MYFKILVVFLLFFWAFPGVSESRTLYVTDELSITMRTGPSLQHQVLRMLPSGTTLEVLEESTDWFRIRTSDGNEGWVLKQYTMQRTPRDIVIQQLETNIRDLQVRLPVSEQRAADLENENKEIKDKLQSMHQEFDELSQRHQTLLQDSGNIDGIKQDLEDKSIALEEIEADLYQLKKENQELKSEKSLQWFLAGGGFIMFTALIGFILGRVQRRKAKRFSY